MVFIYLYLMAHLGIAKDLVFGVYTSEKPSDMFVQMTPVLEYLEGALREQGFDLNLKLKVVPSYQEGIDSTASGRFDCARLGAASFLQALEKEPKLSAMAVERQDGSTIFLGMIVVRTGSNLHSLQDLRHKRFAFGDAESTIGRYLSQALLAENRVFGKTLLSYDYLGRHDKVALAVLAGDFDAGAINVTAYKKFKSRGLRAISIFRNLTKPWVCGPKVEPKLQEAIRMILLKADPNLPAFSELGIEGFAPLTKKELKFVESRMKVARRF